jgi:hypothetical protein
MKKQRETRREFMRDTALAAAGMAAGFGGLASQTAQAAAAAAADGPKILNYNPNMEYRRQGKTGLMVSAVCLGGHSRSNDQERAEIVTRCIEAGINYIDACSAEEVRRYA